MHEITSRIWKQSEIEIKNALIAYQIFNAKQHIPTILSAFRGYQHGKLKIRQFRKLMIDIENFHFIYTAITAYCLVAIVENELKLGRTTFEVLRILSASLLDKTAIKELFKHDKTIENMDNSYDLQLSFNF